MPLPNNSIDSVPNEGDESFPSLSPIQVIDSVGPQAANRQPNDLRTRDATLRDRVNRLIENSNQIATGGGASADYYLPRDGSLPMTGHLDLGSQRIVNLADPSNPQDAATKNYVDVEKPTMVRAFQHFREIAVSANAGGGVEQNQVTHNVSTSQNHDPTPPTWIDLWFTIMADDTFGGPGESWFARTTRGQFGFGNLAWTTVFKPPENSTYLPDWIYSDDSPGVTDASLPSSVWSARSVDTSIPAGRPRVDQYGIYVLSTPQVGIDSGDTLRVFTVEVNNQEEVSLDLAWNNATPNITVTLRSRNRNIVLAMVMQWRDTAVFVE